MKQFFTKASLVASLFVCFTAKAQITDNFDGATHTLSVTNTFYKNTTLNNWKALSNTATFEYKWNTSFNYWESGSAYTNVNDSSNGTFSNLYGCAAFNAYNGSNYVTSQSKAVVSFSNNTTSLSGFFVTNTTYAYKIMKYGNSFSRKFGDTTGTGSGNSIPQGQYPDWFKLTVIGYQNGILKADSIKFYLADYRATGTINDYVIKNWQYVNCTNLGVVDSVKFLLTSSDNDPMFGMNTPAFFSLDNISIVNTVGINELASVLDITVYPNPSQNDVTINYVSTKETNLTAKVFDISGKEIINQKQQTNLGADNFTLPTSNLEAGIYFIELLDGVNSKKIKFIKL